MEGAPVAVRKEQAQVAAFGKAFRKAGGEFGSNFALATLGFDDAREGDELAGYSTISSV